MEVKDYDIEYIDEIHTYLVNGVITPSVSELIRFIYPDKYSNIPKKILEEKAVFGTHVHNAIECFETGRPFELTAMEQLCFDQYLKLKEEYQIEVIDQEKIVHYEDRFAGRLDMIANIRNKEALVDVKTTAQLDYESLEWQLGFYSLAYAWLYGVIFDKFYCLWLPKKDLGRLVEITPKTIGEMLEVLDRYENSRKAK